MQEVADKKGHEYALKTPQRQAFLEIFNMHAKNGKIDAKALKGIFNRIWFSISESDFSEICKRTFSKKDSLTFSEFMEAFVVKESDYEMNDIKNSLKLLAGDENQYLPIEALEAALKKVGIQKEKSQEMMVVLGDYISQDKNQFDFQLFLSHLK